MFDYIRVNSDRMYNQSLFLLGFLTSWATFNDPLFFGRFPRCLIDCPRLFPKRSDWISHVVYIYIYSYIAKYNKDINKYKQRTGRLYSTSQLKIVNNSSLYCKDLTMTKRRHESSLKAFTTYKLIHLLSLYFSGETFVCMTIGEWHPANAKGQRYYKARLNPDLYSSTVCLSVIGLKHVVKDWDFSLSIDIYAVTSRKSWAYLMSECPHTICLKSPSNYRFVYKPPAFEIVMELANSGYFKTHHSFIAKVDKFVRLALIYMVRV